jgi:thiamine pyrophosphate-dependent acetolactate synthase large subunit-like protein
VATTPKAKGVFPEDHPLSLGVFGLGGHPSVRAYAERGLDVLIAIGTSLGDVATDGWSPAAQGAPGVRPRRHRRPADRPQLPADPRAGGAGGARSWGRCSSGCRRSCRGW